MTNHSSREELNISAVESMLKRYLNRNVAPYLSPLSRNEDGQSIVLITLVFIVLLAFTALAVDAGLGFVRSSQFSKSADAAALAGVVDLNPYASTDEAKVYTSTVRAKQFLSSNGWPNSGVDGIMTYTISGLPQYAITATYPVDFYFARLIGLDSFEITHHATAAYYSQAEIPVPTGNDDGRIRQASQFNVGSDGCTLVGDPVIPLRSDSDSPNLGHSEFGGVYRYRIRIPDTYVNTHIRVELFDPDSINSPSSNIVTVTHSLAYSASHSMPTESFLCTSSGPGDSCVVQTNESLNGAYENPLWFVRVDENWDPNCQLNYNDRQGDTITTFTLYYLDEDGKRQNIESYTNDNSSPEFTDMKWYLPPNFEYDISSIATYDYAGYRHVYLEVTSEGGSAKNVWDIRAGPPIDWPGGAVDVNQRNLLMANNPAAYGTQGIYVEALGRMPVQYHLGSESIKVPLTAVKANFSQSSIYFRHFDYDSGAPPPTIRFTISTLPYVPNSSQPLYYDAVIVPSDPNPTSLTPIEATCDNGTNCDNSWSRPQYAFPIPSNLYAGGVIEATFVPNQDAFVWSASVVAGRPVLTD